jgi:uncharacterized protein YoxC
VSPEESFALSVVVSTVIMGVFVYALAKWIDEHDRKIHKLNKHIEAVERESADILKLLSKEPVR